jgi:hypothetical protein
VGAHAPGVPERAHRGGAWRDYRDTFEVVLHPQDTTFQPHLNTEVEIDGTYRLIWHQLLRTYDPNRYPFGEELPESLRVSNTFRLSR